MSKPTVFELLKQQLFKRSAQQKAWNFELFKSIKERDLSKMQEALEHGAKLEGKGRIGQFKGRPLEFALQVQFEAGIFLLLSHGAKLHSEFITNGLLRGKNNLTDAFLVRVGVKFIQHGWRMDDSHDRVYLRIMDRFHPAVMAEWRAEKNRVLEEEADLDFQKHLKETLPTLDTAESNLKPAKPRL